MHALLSFTAGLALVAAFLGTLACSDGDGEDTQSGGAEQPAATIAVAAPTVAAAEEPTAAVTQEAGGDLEVIVQATNDYSYEPNEVELRAGEPVTLVLDSSRSFESHSFVIDEIEGANVSADAGIVASTEFTPLEPGTYTFYCSVAGHREEGMEGTLIIVE